MPQKPQVKHTLIVHIYLLLHLNLHSYHHNQLSDQIGEDTVQAGQVNLNNF